jgi:hypothetical protein
VASMSNSDRHDRKSNCYSLIAFILVLLSPMASHYVMPPVSFALGDQTREQCERCCRSAGHEEYYLEQCILKCFRNPDHCVDRKAGRPTQEGRAPSEQARPEAVRRVPAETQAPGPGGPRTMRTPPPGAGVSPPGTARPAPAAEPPRGSSDSVQLVWPSPLNLAPGRESEAAAQILALNGIPAQHPGYPTALMAIQNVLINFARTNPGGGKLPTGELARIIMQYK